MYNAIFDKLNEQDEPIDKGMFKPASEDEIRRRVEKMSDDEIIEELSEVIRSYDNSEVAWEEVFGDSNGLKNFAIEEIASYIDEMSIYEAEEIYQRYIGVDLVDDAVRNENRGGRLREVLIDFIKSGKLEKD